MSGNFADLPELCSKHDIAKYLGVSPDTVADICHRNEMSYTLVGRQKIVIMKDDLLEYLESRKCQRKAEAHISTGGQTEAYGRSSSMNVVVGIATLRAQRAGQKLRESLKNSSQGAGKRRAHVTPSAD